MARKWWTLIAVCTATFVLLLDITVVNVALPEIARDLDASFTDLQWVVDAYTLTLAALLLLGGSMADQFGRRLIFSVGIAIFICSSAVCGFAVSPLMLNLARAVQGIGGAFMFATGLALIAATFPPKERGTAIGVWGAVTGAGVAVGPLIGGVLVDAIGWESIFFINLPIGLVTLAITAARVDESKDPSPLPLDWLGTVVFSLGLFALIFALIRGNPEGWSSGLIVGLLVAAAVLLIAFLVIEGRAPRPTFDLALFRKPSFVAASLAAFALSASVFSMFLYLALYLQNILGYDALGAGLRFLPVTVVSFAIAPAAGKFAEKLGVRWFLSGGLLLVGIGLVWMGGVQAGDSWTVLLGGFMVAGAGTGLTNPALATAAIGVVDARRAGMASGINSTFRQIGIATGIAVWGAVFEHRATDAFIDAATKARLPGGPTDGVADFILFGGAARSGNPALAKVAEEAFAAGLNRILILGAVVAFVGAVLAGVLTRRKDFIAEQERAAAVTA
jgi:EmrB/QacA subfamily drug resistance transporter